MEYTRYTRIFHSRLWCNLHLAILILSVRLSVTRRYCIKTDECIVMIFSPHDSSFILVFTADACSVGNSQLSCFKLSSTSLRGHILKLYKPQVHLDVRNFFSQLGLCVGYTIIWSGIYECNEYIPLQTMV